VVCGQGINRFDDPHAFHAEGCPARDAAGAPCHERYGCWGDVHESCCPTCTGQAFAALAADDYHAAALARHGATDAAGNEMT
jgi:hypothetical protein